MTEKKTSNELVLKINLPQQFTASDNHQVSSELQTDFSKKKLLEDGQLIIKSNPELTEDELTLAMLKSTLKKTKSILAKIFLRYAIKIQKKAMKTSKGVK